MSALTALKGAGMAVAGTGSADQSPIHYHPAEMPLDKIYPDPENARRKEDEDSEEGIEEQQRLSMDIKKRGVKSPISLRPHPFIADAYVINFGHRRFKGAKEAGLATIPYFLDLSFDSYDQVKENLLHRKPSIWALADFVQRKMDEKQSKREIAEGLGKQGQQFITELIALIDAPICLHRAYASGVTSPRTLYDLRRAYDDFPEQIDTWCNSGARISRETIQERLNNLRRDVILHPRPTSTESEGKVTQSSDKTADVQESPSFDERQGLVTEQSSAALCGHQAAPQLRRDVIRDQEVIFSESECNVAPPSVHSNAGQASFRLEGSHESSKGGLTTASMSHHSGSSETASEAQESACGSAAAMQLATNICLEYRGQSARFDPNAVVTVMVEGQTIPQSVPLSDLFVRCHK